VHIHGGAWRDPLNDARSIEPAVAHAFSDFDDSSPIVAVASLNYSLSQFPAHPSDSYDAVDNQHSDPAREAVHPQHVSDIFHGLAFLRSLGFHDRSYILTSHSSGATLALQATLQPARYYGLEDIPEGPCPAAAVGLNGVYDLPALVHGLGPSHQSLGGGYKTMLSNAFGPDERKWSIASPAQFDPVQVAERVRADKAPRLVMLDHSEDDQILPVNQRERIEANLRKVSGLRVVVGNRCTGKHAEPWQQGFMIWESVRDAVRMLQEA
jgi:kynurenine formamidase